MFYPFLKERYPGRRRREARGVVRSGAAQEGCLDSRWKCLRELDDGACLQKRFSPRRTDVLKGRGGFSDLSSGD